MGARWPAPLRVGVEKGDMADPDRGVSRRLDRWAGGCLIAAAVLILPVTVHPDIFETTLADAALDATSWVPMHAGLVLAAILSLVGWSGLYAPRADRLGRLGAIGFALVVPGLVMAACLFYAEAFLLPVIAAHAPEVFAWDGPVVTSWAAVISASLAGLWVLGLALLGLALRRSAIVPAGAALTLTVGAIAFAVLAGPFVPVLGPLSTVVFAGGHVWIGAALVTGSRRAIREPDVGTPVAPTSVPPGTAEAQREEA